MRYRMHGNKVVATFRDDGSAVRTVDSRPASTPTSADVLAAVLALRDKFNQYEIRVVDSAPSIAEFEAREHAKLRAVNARNREFWAAKK